MEVIDNGVREGKSESSASSSRPSSSSSRRAPPIMSNSRQNSFTRPPNSPIKEMKTLVAVKRKEPTSLDDSMQSLDINANGNDALSIAQLNSDFNLTGGSRDSGAKSSQVKSRETTKPQPTLGENRSVNGIGREETTDGSSSSDEDDEGEERKAPNELVMEFLQCVMSDDHENSLKLCKMILLYEPSNSRALQFLPLLELKKQQAERESSDDDDDDGGDDGDSEDDTDDTEDEDSDDDDDDDDSDDDTDEDGVHNTNDDLSKK